MYVFQKKRETVPNGGDPRNHHHKKPSGSVNITYDLDLGSKIYFFLCVYIKLEKSRKKNKLTNDR